MIDYRRAGLAKAAANLTSAPVCLVRVPLEGEVEVRLLAKTIADQQRIVDWLRRSRIVGEIPQAVADALDNLEGVE